MTGATRRSQSLIDKYGETFLVGAVQHVGIFSYVTVGTDKSYMPGTDVDSAGVPLYICLVRDDDTTALADVIAWNSLALTVKRILQARFRSEVASKMLVLSQQGTGGGGVVEG